MLRIWSSPPGKWRWFRRNSVGGISPGRTGFLTSKTMPVITLNLPCWRVHILRSSRMFEQNVLQRLHCRREQRHAHTHNFYLHILQDSKKGDSFNMMRFPELAFFVWECEYLKYASLYLKRLHKGYMHRTWRSLTRSSLCWLLQKVHVVHARMQPASWRFVSFLCIIPFHLLLHPEACLSAVFLRQGVFLSVFDVCTRNVPEEEKLTGRRLGIIESGIIDPSLRASFGFQPWHEKNCSAAPGGFTVVFVIRWSFWLTPGIDRKRSGSYTNQSISFIHNTVDNKDFFLFPGVVILSDRIIIHLCSW